MQMFTVQAATPASAAALYSALSPFHPELETDDEGRCSVSVALGSDRQVLQVLDAIHQHLRSRGEVGTVNSLTVALDERTYTLHG
jgi:hypothetical protein